MRQSERLTFLWPVGQSPSLQFTLVLPGCLQPMFIHWWREQISAAKDLVRKLELSTTVIVKVKS